MSIIRSNIARQLLAEGGAPRKGYRTGGDIEDDVAQMEASMGISGGPSPSEYADMDQEGQAEVDQSRFDAGFRTPDFTNMGVSDNAADRGFFGKTFDAIGTGLQNRRGQSIMNFLGRSTAPTMRGTLGLGTKGDINYILEQLQANKGDPVAMGLTNKQFEIGQKLIDAGIVDEFDIRNMTQSKFDELFPGPQTGEGGDNEPIKKLRAPITEKKEEESKGEFDDILKFYGSKFAGGGRIGFADGYSVQDDLTDYATNVGKEASPGGGFEDSGDGGGPPTMGGGTEPPMLSEGRGIDVGALQRQGLTPADILSVYNSYYGVDTTPTVAGPLGTAPGGLMGTGPGTTFGQEVPGGLLGAGQGTKGTTGTKGLGFAFTPEAAKAVDKVYGSGLKERTKMYEDVFKADGGAIRQNYGLGSIVKKAVGAVKKVAKSPIGKAALFAGLGAYGLGAGPFAQGSTMFGGKLAGLSGSGFLKSGLMKKLLLKNADKGFGFGNINSLALLGIPTVASYLMSKKEEEDETLPTVANTDPEFQKYLSFYGGPRRFAQTGGDIDEAPMEDMPRQEMASNAQNDEILERLFEEFIDLGFSPEDAAKKAREAFDEMSKRQGVERTMAAGGGMMNPNDEMLNLSGNEMDLRGGGFVPLGEYEKKDDVPARLSKNEFVFTADAVKAAGGGSVDRGADIMYKTMKNLENKIA